MEVKLLAFLTSITEPSLVVRALFYIVVWESRRIVILLIVLRPDMLIYAFVSFLAFSILEEVLADRQFVLVEHMQEGAVVSLLTEVL
jgi:hypothetical protein|tara:strand:+ start:161 stop:421 length:261 start_codon:yes stop_codon:yes gene_type:complete